LLVLGAGGAARGLLQPIVDEGPSDLLVANRSLDKARRIAALVDGGGVVRVGGYDDLPGQAFDLVINATSASMHGELPAVADSIFRSDGVAYDLAYGLGLTPFLALATSAGVERVVDGVGMLVEQAAEAFAWWRGTRPETRAMIDTLTVPMV
jgi:shikimate dehydrogenase